MEDLIREALELMKQQQEELIEEPAVKIKVIGVGGAGNNMITWLKTKGVQGAELIAVNTDVQQLKVTKADKKILIGRTTFKGLGCGGDPRKGEAAISEDINEIRECLKNADLVFVLAGLGGGTGTGAAPIIAKVAKEMGALVLSVVTIPFDGEGTVRREKAEYGLIRLREASNTVIVIDNNKLLKIAGDRPLVEAFGIANNLIATMIKGLVETIAIPSFINLDFADVKTVMESGGIAIIGMGSAKGEHRAVEAVRKALNNPLLDVDFKGAKSALLHIEGGPDLRLEETARALEEVHRLLAEDSLVILGARINESLGEEVRATVIISGVKSPYLLGPTEKEEKAVKYMYSEDLGINVLV